MKSTLSPTTAHMSYEPIKVAMVELDQPLPVISIRTSRAGESYRRVRLIGRLHHQPLGVVDLAATGHDLSPADYAPILWNDLQDVILAHLAGDGLPPVEDIGSLCASVNAPLPCEASVRKALDDAPFVSVVICTRDRPAALRRCLDAVVGQHYPHFEIIVIDNAPGTSATEELIRQHFANTPSIRYVLEPCPGLSNARNRGCAEARGAIIAFTDDDTVPDPHWLASLAGAFAQKDVACVTGLTFALELDTPSQFWFEEFGGFNKGFLRRTYRLTERTDSPLHPYTAGRFGTGANMAFTPSFLREMGGFDPALGAGSPTGGGEDLDAFFQVIVRGYALVYEPRALMFHEHRRDYEALRKQIYGSGKGLTAYLTKEIAQDVRRLADIGTRLPYGVYFAFSPHSPKNRNRTQSYPKELIQFETRGMRSGPVAYLRAHRTARTARTSLETQTAHRSSAPHPTAQAHRPTP